MRPQLIDKIEIYLDDNGDPVEDPKDAVTKYVTIFNDNDEIEEQYETEVDVNESESLCPNCGEAVDLVGPHPTAQIKKKKRHFEFKEATNDDWKEYEHYLYEDATKSGQKSDTVGNPEFRSFTLSFSCNRWLHSQSHNSGILQKNVSWFDFTLLST